MSLRGHRIEPGDTTHPGGTSQEGSTGTSQHRRHKEENESLFYTNITLDGRLITVGENHWDLRSRHKFDEVHIDMNDIYADEEEENPEEEEDDGLVEDDYN